MLLAIDPGGCAGWALYKPTGLRSESHKYKLWGCGIWEAEYLEAPTPRPGKWSWFQDVTHVIVEVPQIWPQTPNKQDIITLAIRLGRYLQWVGCKNVREVYPTTWKGTLKKNVHQPRIWDSLRDEEKEILREAGKRMAPDKRHNMIDAVGLGLYAAGRPA